MTKPKLFYYTLGVVKRSKMYGGSTIRAIIYQHTKDGLVFQTYCDYNTKSFRGTESEVLATLVKEGKLPKVKGYEPQYGYLTDYNNGKDRVVLRFLQTAEYGHN